MKVLVPEFTPSLAEKLTITTDYGGDCLSYL